MPATLVLLAVIALIALLPKPVDPILRMVVTWGYLFVAGVGLSVATYQFGWTP